jgi:hypothetical protein
MPVCRRERTLPIIASLHSDAVEPGNILSPSTKETRRFVSGILPDLSGIKSKHFSNSTTEDSSALHRARECQAEHGISTVTGWKPQDAALPFCHGAWDSRRVRLVYKVDEGCRMTLHMSSALQCLHWQTNVDFHGEAV